MRNIAIFGSAFGDEAKAAVCSRLSGDFDFVVKYTAGANSGHTAHYNGKKYIHSLVPTIDFSSPRRPYGYIASGCVVDLEQLYTELTNFEKDFPGVSRSIFLDKDAFIVTAEHKRLDKEKNAHIGTTGKGIGEAYLDAVGRKGMKVADCFAPGSEYNPIIKRLESLGLNFVYSLQMRERFEKSSIIFEGSQAALLDLNVGTYPFVTSSNTLTAGIHVSGFGFVKLNDVYGITKGYVTRVGNGPFPTEFTDEEFTKSFRDKAGEFGAVTGRPRRCGWLDLVSLKYAIKKSGITSLILTKVDVLDSFENIKVCYSYEGYGQEIYSASQMTNAVSRYLDLDGWSKAPAYDKYNSKEFKTFIKTIENFVDTKVSAFTFGVNKEDIKWI